MKDVDLDGIQIKGLERLRVIELFTHRIGQGGVLTENVQFQLIWPPVTISRTAACALF